MHKCVNEMQNARAFGILAFVHFIPIGNSALPW